MSGNRRLQVTDEWLYKHMPVVDKAMVRDLEASVEKDYPISGACERKMRKLIRREKYGLLMQMRGGLKRVVAIFVGLIGAFSLVTMGVEAERLVFFKTIVTDFGDHVVKQFEAYGDEEFVVNEPGYIPEGYELIESGETIVNAYWNYQNDRGQWLLLDQAKPCGTYDINAEYDFQEEIQIGGEIVKVDAYDSGQKYIFYEHEDCIFELDADNLSLEEIVKIYEEWVK